jgi:two-component system response regulator MtrA
VVVVDDDPVIQAILEAVLSGGGYRVELAPEASGAVAAVRRTRPAAVLVDRMLPGRDGIDLCRDLRAEPESSSRPSIVLLTADADRVQPELAAAAGIDAVVAKPFQPAELLQLLSRLRHSGDGADSARPR